MCFLLLYTCVSLAPKRDLFFWEKVINISFVHCVNNTHVFSYEDDWACCKKVHALVLEGCGVARGARSADGVAYAKTAYGTRKVQGGDRVAGGYLPTTS